LAFSPFRARLRLFILKELKITPKIIPAALIAAALATSAMADCNTGAAIRAKHPAPVLSGLPGVMEGSPEFIASTGSEMCVDDAMTQAYGPFLHGEWIAVVFKRGLSVHSCFVKEEDWEAIGK
jgi:hypothetical protein